MTNPPQSSPATKKLGPLGIIVGVIIIVAVAVFQQSPEAPSAPGTPPRDRAATQTTPASTTNAAHAPARWDTVGGSAITDPEQVRGIWDTLQMIKRGPPFPHRQDGVVFENREGRLARHPNGWWHEYTVVTPGAGDRGARRLVVGSDGEAWYTEDHYRTFSKLRLP
ncbi:MAG: ribonuclease domain-containing protein [Planctomycetota bacterium]